MRTAILRSAAKNPRRRGELTVQVSTPDVSKLTLVSQTIEPKRRANLKIRDLGLGLAERVGSAVLFLNLSSASYLFLRNS